jgi:DtxR family Mn-dependent transcriptional regulator
VTSPVGFHPPLEEYLEAIHELEEEGAVPVIQARLADRVGHSGAAVSEMVGRLRTRGYLATSGRALELTEKGRARAESVVRKHRLAERLLTDVIGLPWHKAHAEACRWEHVISDDVEARIFDLLGRPSTCPHGNPIPGSDAPPRTLVPLAAAQPQDRLVLERVTEQVEMDSDALTYLSVHNFLPGTEAVVAARAPDGTLLLQLAGGRIALGPTLAAGLYASQMPPRA